MKLSSALTLFAILFASTRDFFGGRSHSYEEILRKAKDMSMEELEQCAQHMGANAVVEIDVDYETVGSKGSMLMVIVSGTAVYIE